MLAPGTIGLDRVLQHRDSGKRENAKVAHFDQPWFLWPTEASIAAPFRRQLRAGRVSRGSVVGQSFGSGGVTFVAAVPGCGCGGLALQAQRGTLANGVLIRRKARSRWQRMQSVRVQGRKAGAARAVELERSVASGGDRRRHARSNPLPGGFAVFCFGWSIRIFPGQMVFLTLPVVTFRVSP